MYYSKRIARAILVFGMLWSIQAKAQMISIDRGLRMEGLWCFPLSTDTNTYVYLPDRAMLAVDDQKQPQFSFIRYVNSATTSSSPDKSITEAGGGGVLHFLVTYDTDDKKVKKAQDALREMFHNDEIKLRGPVVFKEGRFALVSTILSADGKPEKQLMAMGAAPVLQGSRIALSFDLDPQHSKLLLESFKMATPDVSIVFDMTFSGLTDAYNAKLTVDWSEVSKNEKISAGVNVYFVSADLEKVYAELRRTNAIKLETNGDDSKMDNLVTSAYNKITDMMFRPVQPEQLAASDQGGLGALLGSLFSNGGNGAFSSGKTFGFGAHVGYKLKEIKMSGYSVLNFNSRNSTDRHHYITFNIGDIYKKYGQNTQFFRTVSLSDDPFLQRDIYVGVDGSLLPEFDKLINNITVTLRKVHQDSTVTLRETNVVKSMIVDNKTMSMSYGYSNDSDRSAWLNYDFRAQYNFIGGKTYQTDWKQQNAAMINLFAPYERRTVKLEADSALLKSLNVRAITVRVEYPFFGDKKVLETTVRPTDDLTQKQFDITLPAGQYKYSYTIRWRMKDGTEKVSTGDNDTGILFIDTLNDK